MTPEIVLAIMAMWCAVLLGYALLITIETPRPRKQQRLPQREA